MVTCFLQQQVNWTTSIIQAQLLGQNDADGAGTSGKKNWKIKIAQYVKKPQKQQGDSALFKKMHKWSNYYLYMYTALGKMEMVRSKTSKVYCVSLPSPWFHFLSFLSIRLPCAQFITTWQTDVSTDGNCSDPSCYIQMCWQRGLF